MKQPSLRDMIKQAEPGQLARDKKAAGPRRALLQCHHGDNSRFSVGEVWGNAVFVPHGPHDVARASYAVYIKCKKCPGQTGLRVLDLKALRHALAVPHTGLLKIDVDSVSRRVAPKDNGL